jgi:hypothetical protein
MSAHVLPPLAVYSKSERKVNSLPPLEFEPATFGMLAHLSVHSVKSHWITVADQISFSQEHEDITGLAKPLTANYYTAV